MLQWFISFTEFIESFAPFKNSTVHDLITFNPGNEYAERMHDYRIWASWLLHRFREISLKKLKAVFFSCETNTGKFTPYTWLKSNRSSLDKMHLLYFSIRSIILSQKAFEFMESLGEFVRDKTINRFTWYNSMLPGMLFEYSSLFLIHLLGNLYFPSALLSKLITLKKYLETILTCWRQSDLKMQSILHITHM